MDTSELPAALLQSPKLRYIPRTAKQKIHLDHYRNTYVFNTLETELQALHNIEIFK